MDSINTSNSTFSRFREEGFLYIDKTTYLHQWASKRGQYFLSRPRRFGKSLLVSTFKALFQSFISKLYFKANESFSKVSP
ncbi:MAG: AAA family ATPase [Planctomycetes bacterium]|nr:AAA family ATPase [Planctomycetota bacterium]